MPVDHHAAQDAAALEDVDSLSRAWLHPRPQRLQHSPRILRARIAALVGFVIIGILATTIFNSPLTALLCFLAAVLVAGKQHVTRLDTRIMLSILILVAAEVLAHAAAAAGLVLLLLALVAASLVWIWGYLK